MGMARRIRQEGQSQLDYLWVNYGDFATSSVPTDDPDTIITQGAIKSLLQEFKGVASVEVIDKEGKYKGRKKIKRTDIDIHYDRYMSRKASKTQIATELGISRNTLTRLFNEYEKTLSGGD